jgi:uncharacterized peroxidase-related enzyme
MPRLKVWDPETTKGWRGRLLKKVGEASGKVPNMFRSLGNSPWCLDGFLTLNGNIAQGKIGMQLVKIVTLGASEFNGCEYCVAAHTAMAEGAGLLTKEQALDARRFKGVDERSNAALAFTKEVLETKGKVSGGALKAVRDAGFDDEELVEIISVISMSTLANYVSNVGDLDVDFPEVPSVS